MDQAPRGVYRLLTLAARSIGLVTIGGYVVFVLFIFEILGPSPSAALMTLAAGAKLVHDGILAFVRYRLGTRLSSRDTI